MGVRVRVRTGVRAGVRVRVRVRVRIRVQGTCMTHGYRAHGTWCMVRSNDWDTEAHST